MIYLFDLDGTLSEARKPVSHSFDHFLCDWLETHDAYIVTASDFPKLQEQCSTHLLDNMNGSFTCMGNELWKGDNNVYHNDIDWNPSLYTRLEDLWRSSQYSSKFGNHIELRSGLINFSTVGRNANATQRNEYTKWDNINKERQNIVDALTDEFPMYDFLIGGRISIDIVPTTASKVLAVKWLRDNDITEDIAFFGDNCQPGGNDYDIAEMLKMESNSNIVYEVAGPHDTQTILTRYIHKQVAANN